MSLPRKYVKQKIMQMMLLIDELVDRKQRDPDYLGPRCCEEISELEEVWAEFYQLYSVGGDRHRLDKRLEEVYRELADVYNLGPTNLKEYIVLRLAFSGIMSDGTFLAICAGKAALYDARSSLSYNGEYACGDDNFATMDWQS